MGIAWALLGYFLGSISGVILLALVSNTDDTDDWDDTNDK